MIELEQPHWAKTQGHSSILRIAEFQTRASTSLGTTNFLSTATVKALHQPLDIMDVIFLPQADVPKAAILLGCKGSAKATDIQTLASESVDQGLLGIVVWYASAIDGLRFEPSWDVSSSKGSVKAFQAALALFKASIQ